MNNINYRNLIISIILLFCVGFIYNKFKINVDKDDKLYELNIIKKYLLNERDYYTIEQLGSINKPLLWVYIDYSKNSRSWLSFGSRNTHEINQDYLYLTLRSIINKCGDYFHIIFVDDDSFSKLLENWNVNLSILSNPQKDYMVKLGLVKILCKYGGILMSPSFILFKSLANIYDSMVSSGKMIVGEFKNNSLDGHMISTMPSMELIGCNKECKVMNEFRNYLEILFSNDYTNSINVENLLSKWLYNKINSNNITYIDAKLLGVKDNKNKLVPLEELMGSSYLEFHPDAYGIYIPKDELLKRNAYNWFVYLDTDTIIKSNTNISKYLLLCNAK